MIYCSRRKQTIPKGNCALLTCGMNMKSLVIHLLLSGHKHSKQSMIHRRCFGKSVLEKWCATNVSGIFHESRFWNVIHRSRKLARSCNLAWKAKPRKRRNDARKWQHCNVGRATFLLILELMIARYAHASNPPSIILCGAYALWDVRSRLRIARTLSPLRKMGERDNWRFNQTALEKRLGTRAKQMWLHSKTLLEMMNGDVRVSWKDDAGKRFWGWSDPLNFPLSNKGITKRNRVRSRWGQTTPQVIQRVENGESPLLNSKGYRVRPFEQKKRKKRSFTITES